MTDFTQMNIFFFISSIFFTLLTIFMIVVIIYVLPIIIYINKLYKKIKRAEESVEASVINLSQEAKENFDNTIEKVKSILNKYIKSKK